MEIKCKEKSGLNAKRRSTTPQLRFTEDQQHSIIQDYLSSGLTKTYIWEKYTGRKTGQFQILRWMQKFGYADTIYPIIGSFASNPLPMKKKGTSNQEESFETEQLKKRIAELEKELAESNLKAVAFSKMVDIAEKELNISIRKKHNTKPSKK